MSYRIVKVEHGYRWECGAAFGYTASKVMAEARAKRALRIAEEEARKQAAKS